MRSAFVLDHLRLMARGEGYTVASMQHNPFELLEHYPGNYVGVLSASQEAVAPAGGWLFDPQCVCVGYRPVWTEWLGSPARRPLVLALG